MAAAKGKDTSSTALGTTLQQLDGLPLRLIALKLSNPGPLAASCTAAHRSLSHSNFQVDWFLQWVHVLAPLRPWQHAALGWQRLGGPHATPERLAAVLLLAGAAKRQRLPVQLRPDAAPAAQQPGICILTGAVEQQEQQQQTGAEGASTKAVRQPRHGPMPHFVPSAKVQRQAGKLLAQGHPVAALELLLPGAKVLAYQYAAAAGNINLLQVLVASQYDSGWQLAYPNYSMGLAPKYSRIVNTAKLCAYAALRAGNQHMLTVVLLNAGGSIKKRYYQVWQLFRFAVRHSNAACINTLMSFAPCRDFLAAVSATRLACWPQHLAMAAARVDTWAQEVVWLLLHCMQYTQPKFLAAKYMRPAYTAACRTGHMPVLLQLVQHTLSQTHKEHLAALLEAAADTGNLSVWQQLLSAHNDKPPHAGSSSSGDGSGVQHVAAGGAEGSRSRGLGSRLLLLLSHVLGRESRPPCQAQPQQQQGGAQPLKLSQQQQQPELQQAHCWQQQQVMPAAQVLGGLQWDRLTGCDKAYALLAILDGMCTAAFTTGHEPLLLAADADRVAMADSLLSRLGGEAAVRKAMRSMFSEDASPYASFGGLQELLACPMTPPGKVAWLSEHQMLPVLPDTWQFSPAAQVGLDRMLLFSLSYGQRRMTDALVQLAWGQGMTVSTKLLVQGCFQCALRDAAAAQDLGELERLAAFAEYNNRLAAFASSAWQAVSSQNLPKNELLLSAIAAAWNAAVVLDTEGYPEQLGLPLRQHIRLCAQAVMPVVLQGLPERTMQRMVFEFWWCWTGWGSKCLLQGSHEEITEHLACCALHMHLYLHFPTVSAWRLHSTEPVGFLQCLMQLAAQWQEWVPQGPQCQVLPCNSSSTFAALPLDAAQLPVSPAAAGGCHPRCSLAGNAGTGGMQPLAEALEPLPLVPLHLLAAAILDAAAEDEVPLMCCASDRPAAACTDSSSSSSAGGSGTVEGQAWQHKLLFPSLQQPLRGTEGSPPAATGGTDSADCAAAVGQTAAVAAITSAPAGTCAPRQVSIMPLWQHAALALAAKQGHSWDMKLQFSANEAVLAVLQGPQRASKDFVGTTAGTSADTPACSRSPSFLSAEVSAAQPADTAAGTSEQQVSPAPPAPPEHIALRHILSSWRWLQPLLPSQQQDDDSFGDAAERPVWPMSALHRMDAAAWALHQSPPDASSPLLCKEQRKRLEIALLLALRDSTVVFRTTEWLRQCDQQLRRHRQRMLAGAATSTDAGLGALPGFAAGAADATTALLAAGLPAHISKLVSQLNGGSSAAQVEHVKAVIAAMLAAAREHLPAADQHMRQTGLGEETWLCVRPVALRKALEVGDRDLFTLLWLYNEWVWGFKTWPAEGEGEA